MICRKLTKCSIVILSRSLRSIRSAIGWTAEGRRFDSSRSIMSKPHAGDSSGSLDHTPLVLMSRSGFGTAVCRGQMYGCRDMTLFQLTTAPTYLIPAHRSRAVRPSRRDVAFLLPFRKSLSLSLFDLFRRFGWSVIRHHLLRISHPIGSNPLQQVTSAPCPWPPRRACERSVSLRLRDLLAQPRLTNPRRRRRWTYLLPEPVPLPHPSSPASLPITTLSRLSNRASNPPRHLSAPRTSTLSPHRSRCPNLLGHLGCLPRFFPQCWGRNSARTRTARWWSC